MPGVDPEESDEADVIPIDRVSRQTLRSRRKRDVRSRVENIERLPKYRLRLLAEEAVPTPGWAVRPRTRGDCVGGPRPCPWAGCRHHMAIDVSPKTGGIKFNTPDVEIAEMAESCSLDVADRGSMTLERVGELMNVTRERIRQMELSAAHHFVEVAGPQLAEEFREALGDALNRPGSSDSDDAESSGGGAGGPAFEGRRSEYIGLTNAENIEVERWSNEVVALLEEGVPLPVAQEMANDPFDGPEDPPVCLAPPLPGESGTRVPAASPPVEAAMTRGISESKQGEVNARKDAVLAYL